MELLVVIAIGLFFSLLINAAFSKAAPSSNTPCYNRVPKEVHKWEERPMLGPKGEKTGLTRLWCAKCNRTSDQMT